LAIVRCNQGGTGTRRTFRCCVLLSALATLATLATLAIARRAAASSIQSVELDWRSDDPTCIDQATLARTVETTLDRAVFHSPTAATARIEGTIGAATTGGGFRAKIILRSSSGEVLAERELSTSAATCDRMDESVAIVVALMVDGLEEKPAKLEVPAKVPRPPPPPPAPKPPPRPPPSRVITTEPTARVPLLLEGELGGSFALGLLPRPSLGSYLRGELGVGHAWSMALVAHGFLPSRTVGAGSGAEIHAWAVDANACYAPVHARSTRLVGCLLLGAGFTDATPVGTDRLGSLRLPLAYGGMSFEAAVGIGGPVWVHVRSSIWAPFESPYYVTHAPDGTNHTVFEPWILVPSLSVGIGGRFGS
jgi:hypothetical protein